MPANEVSPMKRVLALSMSAILVLLMGCGSASYNKRLDKTLADMKYRQRLDQYLTPPAADKVKEIGIFLRPPKPLAQSKEFLLTPTADLHDLEASFTDLSKPGSLRLHVLARRKVAKAAAKKGAPPPAESAARGVFKADVFAQLANDFGATEENLAKAVDYNAGKKNAFKRIQFVSPTSGDQIRVYLYENKRENYDVALIWDVPKGQEKDATTGTGIELSLESFAAGMRANRLFETGGGEGEGAAEGEASSVAL